MAIPSSPNEGHTLCSTSTSASHPADKPHSDWGVHLTEGSVASASSSTTAACGQLCSLQRAACSTDAELGRSIMLADSWGVAACVQVVAHPSRCRLTAALQAAPPLTTFAVRCACDSPYCQIIKFVQLQVSTVFRS
jgi:hypothetical protein